MTDIISALRRLQAASHSNSVATSNFLGAAKALGEDIATKVPEGKELPRGYRAWFGSLRIYGYYSNSGRDELDEYRVDETLLAALQFARDVATGWLDELAAWLEERAAEAESAAQSITAAELSGISG